LPTSTDPAPPPGADRRLLLAAWAAMLLMSRLPQILLHEVVGIQTDYAWTWFLVALSLLALGRAWASLRPLRGYFLVMAVVALLTGPLDALLRNSAAWAGWFGAERGWAVAFFGERLPLVLQALVLILVLTTMGLKRRDYFLAVGNVPAPVLTGRIGGLLNSWWVVGPLASLALAGLFFAGSAAQLGGQAMNPGRLLPLAPALLLFALMNGFGEEFVYRAAPLSQLWQVIGERQAIGLTSVWFGLGHFYGGFPSGWAGVLLSGAVAFLFGSAMLASRGIVLPTAMHMLIDTAIYTLLALGEVGGA
jgi:membrane protease YdiL (CAAX protease family)